MTGLRSAMGHSTFSSSHGENKTTETKQTDTTKSAESKTSISNESDQIPKVDGANGLRVKGYPFNASQCEAITTYGKGGNLPVHVGSEIDRYRVVHKLQHLRSSNTWLCIDTKSKEPKYYSVKIMRADAEDNPELWIGTLFQSINSDPPPPVHLALPYQILKVDSPNGSHDVIVTPFIGPRVSHLFSLRSHEEGEGILRKMCHQVTHALTVLHDCNLCHGEVEPRNVLAQLHGLNGRSEEAVLKDIGEQTIDPVLHEKGEQAQSKFAPLYLVYKVDWDQMEGDTIDMTKKAYLSFFERVFKVGDEPKLLSISLNYCAPEWIFDKKGREPSDIWSLACTLFEIRTGEQLFRPTHHDFDQILSLCMMLGKMPEPWWSEKWPNRKKLFEDKADEKGQVVPLKGITLPGGVYRSIREAVETCLDHIDRSDPDDDRSLPRKLEKKELDLFVDLLEKMLKWKPEDRIKKDELLAHPWFKL